MKILTGIESTHIYGTPHDVIELTRHLDMYEHDLHLVYESGITTLRYSVPWHRIESVEGVYDFSWMDNAMQVIRSLGIDPILDPLHHTSFPEWLRGGFLNEKFPQKYCAFLEACAERYPWAKKYTIINEPFVTALLCGKLGVWYPYKRSNKVFLRMLMNLAKAISLGCKKLICILGDPEFLHTDAAEVHRANTDDAISLVSYRNNIRFLFLDMVLGKIDSKHPLYIFVRKYISKKELTWLENNPSRIDILGLDYYAHSECEWKNHNGKEERVWPSQNPIGFAAVAMQYHERYGIPIMLAETNIRGTVTDRISWLKFMLHECEKLEIELKNHGGIFKGFCWYSFLDTTDWSSLVREPAGRVDPQGIILLDPNSKWSDESRCKRIHSELSVIYSRLAQGKIHSSKEIRAYEFPKEMREMLAGFMPLMNWQFVSPQ